MCGTSILWYPGIRIVPHSVEHVHVVPLVYTSTYQYVPVHTGMYQVYKNLSEHVVCVVWLWEKILCVHGMIAVVLQH